MIQPVKARSGHDPTGEGKIWTSSDDAMSLVSESGQNKRKFRGSPTDSEVEDQTRSSGRVLRSRIIKSDSDVEPADSAEDTNVKTKKKRKPMVRGRDANLDTSFDFSSLVFTPCPVSLAAGALDSRSADEISGVACG